MYIFNDKPTLKRLTIKNQPAYSDEDLLFYLNKGNIDAFKQIYLQHWSDLYQYAYNILRNKTISEEIVQETFVSLWRRHETLKITQTLRAYLFTAVKFQVLNYMKSEKVKRDYAASYYAFKSASFDNSNEENIRLTDLKEMIETEVSKLPEKCQQIFRLSRDEHQSIKTIAEMLNISSKTVENQLTKALKQLRSSLGQFFSLLLFIMVAC